MLKFFRNIRQRLLSDGKNSKYLKYAFGEIFLVVIGILIALQINNWNERNNQRNKLNTYLTSLVVELNSNVRRLDRAANQAKIHLEQSVDVIIQLNGDSAKDISSSDFNEFAKVIGPFFKIELYSAVYKDLINSGVLENLKDEDLKRNIFRIERYLENYDEGFMNARQIWDDFLLPYYHEHKNVSAVFDSIAHVALPDLAFENDMEAFVNNRRFSNILVSRARQITNLNQTSEAIKSNFEELITEINEYLLKHD